MTPPQFGAGFPEKALVRSYALVVPLVETACSAPEGKNAALVKLPPAVFVGVAPATSNHTCPLLVATISLPLSPENAAAVAPITCVVPLSSVVTVLPLNRKASAPLETRTALPLGA